MKMISALFFFGILSLWSVAEAKTVRYELVAENKPVNISGKRNVYFAITLNGTIPSPTLEFTEGDEAVIIVRNKIPNEELSIHWHGLLLPPEMDGVPYVTTPPIPPGQSYTFRFKLRQHGTYWYHSHTATQEQKGVYGAFIIHPKVKSTEHDKEAVVVVSDWTDENPDQVVKNLRKDGEYYTFKKGTMRSYLGAIQAGGLKNHLSNEWSRMGGMDLSDVGYDAFLINGKKDTQLLEAHPGERVRLRIINASASTYFYISLAGLPMKVVSADGTDIVPISAKEVLMGMAETFDVIFTVPDHKNYELRATAQDVSGFASGWIGMGVKVVAPAKPTPDLYASMSMEMGAEGHAGHGGAPNAGQMNHEGHNMGRENQDVHRGHGSKQMAPMNSQESEKQSHGNHQMVPPKPSPKEKSKPAEMNHQGHGMVHGQGGMTSGAKDSSPDSKSGTEQAKMFQSFQAQAKGKGREDAPALKAVETLSTDDIRSPINTELPKNAPVRELKFVLGGDMERYIWYIDGKTIAQDYRVTIKEGEVVRMTFVNDTMMHHPFHLHGHFFRVLNPQGSFSPLKHTVDIPPHGSRTIEFYANEPGDWMLHCHNLYHLKTGMARVVSYADFKPSPEMQVFQKQDPHLHDHLYYDGRVEVSTNHAQADLRAQRTWDALEARIETRDYDPVEETEGDLLYRRWFGRFFSVFGGGTYFQDFEQDPTRAILGASYMLPLLIETSLFVDHKGDIRLDVEKRFQWTKYIFSDAEVTFRQDVDTEFEVTLMYANSWSWAAGFMFTEDSAGVGVEYKF